MIPRIPWFLFVALILVNFVTPCLVNQKRQKQQQLNIGKTDLSGETATISWDEPKNIDFEYYTIRVTHKGEEVYLNQFQKEETYSFNRKAFGRYVVNIRAFDKYKKQVAYGKTVINFPNKEEL